MDRVGMSAAEHMLSSDFDTPLVAAPPRSGVHSGVNLTFWF